MCTVWLNYILNQKKILGKQDFLHEYCFEYLFCCLLYLCGSINMQCGEKYCFVFLLFLKAFLHKKRFLCLKPLYSTVFYKSTGPWQEFLYVYDWAQGMFPVSQCTSLRGSGEGPSTGQKWEVSGSKAVWGSLQTWNVCTFSNYPKMMP